MKLFIVILFMATSIFSQDYIRVEKTDWEFMKKTYNETDSALTECDSLNSLYEQRINEYGLQVQSLEYANEIIDDILADKNKQLDLREEQISILNTALNKKKTEIWIYRGATAAVVIAGLLIIL